MLLWVVWRASNTFDYQWQWAEIPGYLWHKGEDGSWGPGVLSRALFLTLRLSLWASLVALTFGLILALARQSSGLYFRLMARSTVEICRNIPPLVLVFIAFYFLNAQSLLPWPEIATEIRGGGPTLQYVVEAFTVRLSDLGVFFSAVLALGLYEAAYFSEIFRGAIKSLGRGQWEASWGLGLSPWQQYRYVILPQVFRRTYPQLAGQFISTVKDSSIVSVISLAELTYSGQQLSTSLQQLFEVWLTVAFLYFLFNFALSLFFRRLEK